MISSREPKRRTRPVLEHRTGSHRGKGRDPMQSASDSIAHQSPSCQISARRERLDELHEAIEHSTDVEALYALADEAERVADELVAAVRASFP